MEQRREDEKITCHTCNNFYITHEPRFPYGCRAMGFKSLRLPALDVRENSGLICGFYKAKAGRRQS